MGQYGSGLELGWLKKLGFGNLGHFNLWICFVAGKTKEKKRKQIFDLVFSYYKFCSL